MLLEGMRWSSEEAVLPLALLQLVNTSRWPGADEQEQQCCMQVSLPIRVRSVSFSLPDPSSRAGPGLLFFHSSLGLHIYGHPTLTGVWSPNDVEHRSISGLPGTERYGIYASARSLDPGRRHGCHNCIQFMPICLPGLASSPHANRNRERDRRPMHGETKIPQPLCFILSSSAELADEACWTA